MCVQRLGTVEWYTVTIRCTLVAWAWLAVLEQYDNMSRVCMWGLLRAGVVFSGCSDASWFLPHRAPGSSDQKLGPSEMHARALVGCILALDGLFRLHGGSSRHFIRRNLTNFEERVCLRHVGVRAFFRACLTGPGPNDSCATPERACC